jgi:hypothetical protein
VTDSQLFSSLTKINERWGFDPNPILFFDPERIEFRHANWEEAGYSLTKEPRHRGQDYFHFVTKWPKFGKREFKNVGDSKDRFQACTLVLETNNPDIDFWMNRLLSAYTTLFPAELEARDEYAARRKKFVAVTKQLHYIAGVDLDDIEERIIEPEAGTGIDRIVVTEDGLHAKIVTEDLTIDEVVAVVKLIRSRVMARKVHA